MRILLGLAILTTLALLASSRRFWSVRRTRLGAVLTTGGWLMIAVGMSIGPHGAALVSPEQLLVVKPLILFCLGWVGLMVGLQGHRSLFSKLPPLVTRVALADLLLSVLIVGGGALLVLLSLNQPVWASLPVAMVLGVCSVSWSAEVRSLTKSPALGQAATGVIRGSAGVGTMFAIVAYALLVSSFVVNADLIAAPEGASPTDEQLIAWSTLRMFVGLGASALVAIAMGVLGFWLSRLAGRGEGEFLVVLLGLVSFTAGAEATMGFSPVFAAMLTGMVLVNLPGRVLDRLKRVIIEAEQPLAMVLMLVAGVVADPTTFISSPALSIGLIVVVLLARYVSKLGISRRQIRSGLQAQVPTPSLFGLLRQAPLAIALAAGYALSQVGRSDIAAIDGDELLMIVIACGLLSEIGPLIIGPGGASTKRTPRDAPKSGGPNIRTDAGQQPDEPTNTADAPATRGVLPHGAVCRSS